MWLVNVRFRTESIEKERPFGEQSYREEMQ